MDFFFKEVRVYPFFSVSNQSSMWRHVSSEWQSLSEGCEVEIFYKNNGTDGVWYKAIIESKPLSEELCVRLFKDFSLTPSELKDNDKDFSFDSS